MSPENSSIDTNWIDPDDAPELDDSFFERAEIHCSGTGFSREGRISDDTDAASTLVSSRLKSAPPG